jgi:subtilisin family serine protease
MPELGWIPLGPAPDATGRGISIAIVDTGVNFEHPHLAIAGGGVAVEWDDDGITVVPDQHRDRQGHGTCCAALVHWVAPSAALWAVRVTADRPTTDVDRLAKGLELAIDHGAQLILAALGTPQDASGRLQRVVDKGLAAGALIVAPDPGAAVYPARSRGAVPVALGPGLDVGLSVTGPSSTGFVADGQARPMPNPRGPVRQSRPTRLQSLGSLRAPLARGGPPPNFAGPSLSAARVTGALARFAEISGLRGASLVEGFSKLLEVR